MELRTARTTVEQARRSPKQVAGKYFSTAALRWLARLRQEGDFPAERRVIEPQIRPSDRVNVVLIEVVGATLMQQIRKLVVSMTSLMVPSCIPIFMLGRFQGMIGLSTYP